VTRVAPLLLVCLSGCGGALQSGGDRVAAGAVDAVTAPAAQTRIDETVSSAVRAARDAALGSETEARARAVVATVDAQVLRDARKLGDEFDLAMVRAARDALSRAEVDELREGLVGAPLRSDVDALVDEAAPHLAAALRVAAQPLVADLFRQVQAALQGVQAVKADADAEAAKWKRIAAAFAVGSGLLVIALWFAVALVRRHKRTIDRVTRSMADTWPGT
jgi:hypothetical protein